MNLGNAIQSVRKHKGIKQGDMVERTKLTQGYLSQIENNKKDPNLSSLKKISDALEVPLPVIFFLALDNEDIPEKKRDMYNMLSAPIKSFIEEFFIEDPLKVSNGTV